ncbi:hypothetical protein JK635_03535 [Neobacillus sp. YIM B02564]|uniref:Uncharacterized protein n=1 Tax=Neobacillus paridis TaxID=2803862 RepID=A0ABS1TL89_9BACI|nr:hypothetical protein [Neobacillus paridis]MBL4951313.1 hypothetical protein [Neobacillus paridis]
MNYEFNANMDLNSYGFVKYLYREVSKEITKLEASELAEQMKINDLKGQQRLLQVILYKMEQER